MSRCWSLAEQDKMGCENGGQQGSQRVFIYCHKTQDEHGRWNKYGGRLAWDTRAICNNNATFGGTGNHKTGEDYVAAPNIDHTQDFVRADLVKWLKLLRSIGFDGFRFDFVKGYSARPHDPQKLSDPRQNPNTPEQP